MAEWREYIQYLFCMLGRWYIKPCLDASRSDLRVFSKTPFELAGAPLNHESLQPRTELLILE
jgi:hypothetical protein